MKKRDFLMSEIEFIKGEITFGMSDEAFVEAKRKEIRELEDELIELQGGVSEPHPIPKVDAPPFDKEQK